MSAQIVPLRPGEGTKPSTITIAQELRRRITSGQWPLGARISDKQVAAELEISRTPVREALLMLQAEGLVLTRPQSGTFVIDLTVNDIRQICATRAILETGALRLAAAGVANNLPRLGLILTRASVALADRDYSGCDELDCEFHEALVAGSGNAYLEKAYSALSDRLRALRHRLPHEHDRMARALAQHRRILDFWTLGRIDDAVSELAMHVGNVGQLLTAGTPVNSETA
ncbi:MAG: GntR family transcriptional regulator [Pseudorhodoplanes sp.]